jgi:hypothetical protein
VLLAALEADRRRLAPLGGLLLTASSWVRLADAGVGAPEAYAVPLGLLALLLGHLQVRRAPGTGSHAAYGPGLSLLLLPSLVAAVAGTGLARPLLLGLVALVVVGAGAAGRLQAPLLLGRRDPRRAGTGPLGALRRSPPALDRARGRRNAARGGRRDLRAAAPRRLGAAPAVRSAAVREQHVA